MSYNKPQHRIAVKPHHLIAVAVLIVLGSVLFITMSADAAAIMSLKPAVAMIAMSAAAAEPLAAFTIREFCQTHGISVPTYYELKKHGLGPIEMRMGRIIRISAESALAWRRARENPGEAEAEASAQTAEAMRARARRAAKRSVASPRHISRRTAEVT
jgi:predicted DNA-binding transcriptional regulator AlpA